ncbi:MAG: BREX-1 system adenine-specific DNA-methyltransferase PglX [Saccharospirillaceae bacterium]|nr:BREX-1 system adenine-specific DNA-methyltransferase PglX [Saccharospirillaceae bacterium]
MNTKHLKAYAPKARRDFLEAVTHRAAYFGLYEDRIAEMKIEGSSAIIEKHILTRKEAQQRTQLVSRINTVGFSQFINETAFTWVNRLTAIRYMEINEYLDHGFRVLSKSEGAKFGEGFEILAHAADVAEDLGLDKSAIVEMLLDGNKEEALYREILLGQCHQLSRIMPFMFEKLDDATELLLPDNLTKTDSILKELVNDIPEENWHEIEVIGWLYQFYISEHKVAVMGKVVKSEDIPAATQLFTPNWIVKYLVQNSVGRQWLATYPDSELKDKMEYYITPAEQSDDVVAQLKAITPTSIDPESIKVLDPACGSGHILVEVYEVLREIYLERGYRLREIPELILTKNLFGLDIDDRAAQMAAFAVLMKAREDDRRIFNRITDNDIKLNIYSLQSTEHLDIAKLWSALDLEGKHQSGAVVDMFGSDLFDEPADDIPSAEFAVYLALITDLKALFIDAKNIGSLIEVDAKYLGNLVSLKDKLIEKSKGSDAVASPAVEMLLPIIEQAIVLANKYDAVVANPPYMGGKGMNKELKDFAKKSYPNSKSDLFAIFMERAFNFLNDTGYNAQVNMQSWMFLSSYEKMREVLLNTKTFVTMAHLGARAFGQISGEVVQTTAWVLRKKHVDGYQPSFLRLIDGKEEDKKQRLLTKQNLFDQVQQDDFKKIPGSPIAYWVDASIRDLFLNNKGLRACASVRAGMASSDNDRFLRYWQEVSVQKTSFNTSSVEETKNGEFKWFPYNKGGTYRKWYGNQEYVINWEFDGEEIKDWVVSNPSDPNTTHWSRRIVNTDLFFKECLTWGDVSTGYPSFRYLPHGSIIGNRGPAIIPFSNNMSILGFLNSTLTNDILKIFNPTMTCNVGDIANLPIKNDFSSEIENIVKSCIDISKNDWDSFEVSHQFTGSPIIAQMEDTLSSSLDEYLRKGKVATENLFQLENKLDDYIFGSMGIEKSLIDIGRISLKQNPNYRYSSNNQSNNNLTVDVLVEFINYGIGCMMGRYSLDREGLVYAHSGNEGFKELEADGAYNTFPADDDGIIPLASEDWLFEVDATARFKAFVKTVWGEEHLQENLDFVAGSLFLGAVKPKNNENATDTIRRYFSMQFYKDHLKTYKKRPIYWLFSSGKEKAFECLVYLHRYNESTLSRMRTEYVTPLMGKLETQYTLTRDARDTATTAEQRRIDKELKSIEKKQAELRAFDEELKHIAEMKISLDLDDGVKVNYGKFGNLLSDVKGIHGKKPEVIK